MRGNRSESRPGVMLTPTEAAVQKIGQACYAAFTFGLKPGWTYFLRPPPDIDDLLPPLDRTIADALIPFITGHG